VTGHDACIEPERLVDDAGTGIPLRRYASFWAIGVAVVGAALVLWRLFAALGDILVLLAVAVFFTVVLAPAVDFFQSRAHMRRGLATTIVFLIGLGVFGGIGYAFARPVYDASSSFANELPDTIRDAEEGRGDVGRWLKDIGAQDWARENIPKIRESLGSNSGVVFDAGRAVATGIFAVLTIAVLTFLMLLQAPQLSASLLALLPERRAEHVRQIGSDAARAVTGYVTGNLAISLVAGLFAYGWLRVLGVPFAFILALWVAFADLLPLVGATLGAIPPVFVAFLDSPGLGIATIIFFVIYQQFENHVLQPVVMSRTVKLNPLAVLVAVLVGVALAGLLGALLAIPVAGALQVVVRDVWDERRGTVKQVLSVGADETPMTEDEEP
jgi:predicted PurR-regulated permease PerM